MNWVSVVDRLPDKDAAYLIYAESLDATKPLIITAWFTPTYGWSGLPSGWLEAITHWMPLPEPPSSGEKGA